MKKLYSILSLLLLATTLFAVPAKRGINKTITLPGGKTVEITLRGDENMHYWQGSDGVKYVYNPVEATYKAIDAETLKSNAKARMAKVSARAKARKSKAKVSPINPITGKKKGLIILVQFSDVKFAQGDDQPLFDKIANERGFSTPGGFRGSVKDYFLDQSYGQFEMDFDVVGPVTMPQEYAYYGKNDANGYDSHPEEMVAAACKAVDSQVNFADYDWDGDGYVDMVYVIYAGEGEATSEDANTIWPHMSALEYGDYGDVLPADGVNIDVYACSNEINNDGTIGGIGTICHEFSHCLGLADMYDTEYEGNFGMGSWDLMDYGGYNGDGFCPAGYTSFERMSLGWLQPTELSTQSESVTSMRPLTDNGESYIIYNGGNNNEYYLLENRQKTGWDAELPSAGMLILHVDYDEEVWSYNSVNTMDYGNDHQRCTIFHADNDDDSKYLESDEYGNMFYYKTTEETDPYPYLANDSITDNSVPSAMTYNANTDGKKMMNKAVTNITQNSDGTMDFNFVPMSTRVVGESFFYESFDKCSSTGGNDNLWTGAIADGKFTPDNDGWISGSGSMFGGDQCARFGSGSKNGNVTTPDIDINGNAVLTFKAAPWGSDKNPTLNVSMNGSAIGTYNLTPGRWNDITIPVTGSGTCSITFVPSGRLFLDEVTVSKPTTGIKGASVDARYTISNRIYDVYGRYVGTDINSLPKGVYVINGKKVVK